MDGAASKKGEQRMEGIKIKCLHFNFSYRIVEAHTDNPRTKRNHPKPTLSRTRGPGGSPESVVTIGVLKVLISFNCRSLALTISQARKGAESDLALNFTVIIKLSMVLLCSV